MLLSAPGLRHLYCDDHHPRVSCSHPSSLSKPRALYAHSVTWVTLDPRAAAISACRTFAHGDNTLRVSGALCPCCNLAGALALYSVSSASLGKAVRDSGEGFGAIVTQAAQYEINDVRSLKQDSFQVRLFKFRGHAPCLVCASWRLGVRKAKQGTALAVGPATAMHMRATLNMD